MLLNIYLYTFPDINKRNFESYRLARMYCREYQ